MLLLLQVGKVSTERLGCELRLLVAEEDFPDVGPANQIQAREILETFEPIIGPVKEEAGELLDLPFVGSPLANCGGIVAAIQEVPGHVIILVLATVEEV